MKARIILICLLLSQLAVQAQLRDTGTFIEMKPGYYQNYILKGIETFEDPHIPQPARKYFGVDLSKIKLPNDIREYTTIWRQPPISQGNTGTCWSFGSTSMMESEIWRITGRAVKLSEMYTVYWEYVERAIDFVNTRGETYYAEGSESNAILRIMKKHGAMPYQMYTGLLAGQTVHNHENMIAALQAYLETVKQNAAWNEDVVVNNVRAILDSYMGCPPENFEYQGELYTSQRFLQEVCQIDPNNYYSFMSTLSQTYNQKGELVEADNWWHNKDYYNVSIEDFLLVAINTTMAGYGLCMCGDVSEPGFDKNTQTGIIPSFDIPSEYIDENAREVRLVNESTTDDHCMHLIGYKEIDGKFWFVLKDSGAGAFDGQQKGYRFVSEDYVKLKMMNLLVYKVAARATLDKIIK